MPRMIASGRWHVLVAAWEATEGADQVLGNLQLRLPMPDLEVREWQCTHTHKGGQTWRSWRKRALAGHANKPEPA